MSSLRERKRRESSPLPISTQPRRWSPERKAWSTDDEFDGLTRKIFRQPTRPYLWERYGRFSRFFAICGYALLLMPGFIRVACHYFFSRQVRRSIKYGDHPRHRLDLYLPKNCGGRLKPVVAFVTGGAYITGYKAWGSLLAQQLQDRDIMVACIHYRNIPESTLSDMVEDASQGISYVYKHIAEHGGDPKLIYVMGQQIGAYLGACTILHQAIKEAAGENVTWPVSRINGFIGLSGGYDLLSLIHIFHSRGLLRSIELGVMEGEEYVTRFSPQSLVMDAELLNDHAIRMLPTFHLFYGTGDHSIPSASSSSFSHNLFSAGVSERIIWFDGKSETDLFFLDPMRGGRDMLYQRVSRIVHSESLDASAPPTRRLVPECMLKLARRFSPL